jgi:hypothetical protein
MRRGDRIGLIGKNDITEKEEEAVSVHEANCIKRMLPAICDPVSRRTGQG